MHLWLLIVSQAVISAQCFFHKYPKIKLGKLDDGDPGEPLFLTPYIESRNITEGRRLAQVPITETLQIRSYAGFLTVNKEYDSNHFFWYFPAMTKNKTNAPVLLWLQGGPGGSSLFGLFVENGPIMVKDGEFERRQYNWALDNHIIYVDNPVGTGFSFTRNDQGYCTNEVQIGEQLYSTLIQFFQLFPELQKNRFFITGESYAGKYIPALAYTIHKKNPDAKIKINLRALAIGNGFCDPEHQLVYSKYLYQIGLIDSNQTNTLAKGESKAVELIKQKKWNEATDAFNILMNVGLRMSGFDMYYNYLYTKTYFHEDFGAVIQKSSVRKAIHVGNLTYDSDSYKVQTFLKKDFMQSVAPWISELLDHYNILFYNGQLDIIVAYPLTVNFISNLNFTASDIYKTAPRLKWLVNGELAGYVKHAGKLVEVLVRNAGHMVPLDQPTWAIDMINTLTHSAKFSHRMGLGH